MMDYQVGDKVIHWQFGLGEIVQIEEKLIHERQIRCYVVRVRDLSVWVTADESGSSRIRPPTPEGDFETLFAILRSPGDSLPVDRYERKNLLVERMKDGQLASVCAVIRDLSFFGRGKKLNDHDKSLLERAQNFLLAEWTYSLSVPLSQANTELGRLLKVA